MLHAVRAGAPLDAPAYVAALLDAAAEGDDLIAIKSEFRRLGYWTRLDIVGDGEGAGARARAARDAHGWRGAIRVASALGLSDAWSAAMTAYFGPTEIHESYLDADGVPTTETLAKFPRIADAMVDAAERFERLTALYDHRNAGKAIEWRYVVRYSSPAHMLEAL